jgi:hypothetical protein
MNLILRGLAGYPSSADALVLSYYINDIVTACQTVLGEYIYEEGIPQPTGIVQQVVENSHLANYAYWNFYARTRMTDTFERWDQRTQDCFTSDEVWAYHQGELQAIYDWAVIHEIPLVVVLFPSLVNIEAYDTALGRVEDFFTGLGVTVINPSETWKTYPVDQRVVNSLDSHPSLKLHHEIGKALAALDILRHPDAHKPSLPDFMTETGQEVYAAYQQMPPPIPPSAKVLIPLSDELAIDVYSNIASLLLGNSDAEHIMVGLMLRDIWLASRQGNLWLSQGEEEKLYQAWQNTREPEYLTQLGINYLFVTSTWQGWLSQAEANTLADPAKYEVVQKRDFGDEQYSLFRIVK